MITLMKAAVIQITGIITNTVAAVITTRDTATPGTAITTMAAAAITNKAGTTGTTTITATDAGTLPITGPTGTTAVKATTTANTQAAAGASASTPTEHSLTRTIKKPLLKGGSFY